MLVRREFQFPGDLWLPRRENRCRQPPNNHTSYDYHTPGVYTHAPYPCLSFIPFLAPPPPSASSTLTRSSSLLHARALLRPSLPLPRPFSFLPALLQIAGRTSPVRLRKIVGSLNYRALLFSLARSPPHYSFSRTASSYYTLFFRPRFKLSRELRIIIYRPLSYRIFGSLLLSQFRMLP